MYARFLCNFGMYWMSLLSLIWFWRVIIYIKGQRRTFEWFRLFIVYFCYISRGFAIWTTWCYITVIEYDVMLNAVVQRIIIASIIFMYFIYLFIFCIASLHNQHLSWFSALTATVLLVCDLVSSWNSASELCRRNPFLTDIWRIFDSWNPLICFVLIVFH